MYALTIDTNNRILRATFEEFATETDILVETLPDGDISDYKYIDGEYVHDPLPKPPEPEPEPTPSGTGDVSYDELAAAIKEGVNSYNG